MRVDAITDLGYTAKAFYSLRTIDVSHNAYWCQDG